LHRGGAVIPVGPRPHRALTDAIVIARLRGKVQAAVRGPEARYHFTIDSTTSGAFVRVRFTPRILATPADIAYFFRDEILRLRAIMRDVALTRELWLRSKHGTWRFFRVMAEGLVEIDRFGQEIPDKEGMGAGLPQR
jgi:hypothetical protein